MTGVLALALKRLALSHGTVPRAVPVGQPREAVFPGHVSRHYQAD